MLDHDVALPEGVPTAWLMRTLPSLKIYTTVASYILSLTMILLGISGFVSIRRSSSGRPAVFGNVNKKMLRITRGHFIIALIYMLHVLVLMIVDGVICGFAIRDDVQSGSEEWTSDLMIEVAVYCSWLFALFAASFILVPLIQMLVVTWVLARISQRNNRTSLAEFIPEARFFSTHIAQLWCMMSFFVVSWWPPAAEESSLWRFVAIQACLGSALGWLDASFALNFRSDRLAERDIQLSNSGVRQIVAVFGETVKVLHGRSSGGASLPQHQPVTGAGELTKEELEFRG